MSAPDFIEINSTHEGYQIEWGVFGKPEITYALFHTIKDAVAFRDVMLSDPVVSFTLHELAVRTSLNLGQLTAEFLNDGWAGLENFMDAHIARCISELAKVQEIIRAGNEGERLGREFMKGSDAT